MYPPSHCVCYFYACVNVGIERETRGPPLQGFLSVNPDLSNVVPKGVKGTRRNNPSHSIEKI